MAEPKATREVEQLLEQLHRENLELTLQKRKLEDQVREVHGRALYAELETKNAQVDLEAERRELARVREELAGAQRDNELLVQKNQQLIDHLNAIGGRR